MPAGPSLLASWISITGTAPACVDAWSDLVARWSEPHRHYHGLAHLTAVLAVVDRHAALADDPDGVRLAVWFHDAVYDVTGAGNEQRSAQLAEEVLSGLGQPPERVAEVARLVRLTATHRYTEGDNDAALLCDADLAVLAAPPAAYVGYVNAIRAEYAHVADHTFAAARAVVLRGLLDRPALFGLPPTHSAWERPARENLRAELTLLEQ
ncbi:hypothetical protein BH20ACT5_BH20ACT5_06530 [soil metagenome]